MNYLITAAGHGSRFCQAGIKPPKPLIRVMGRELLLWSLSSFAIGPGDNLYIACQREHRVRKRMESLLKFLYPEPVGAAVTLTEIAKVSEPVPAGNAIVTGVV